MTTHSIISIRVPAVVAAALCAWFAYTTNALAQENGREGMRLLHVGAINVDCFADTVWGTMDANLNTLPKLIVWGHADAATEAAAGRDRRKRDSLDACSSAVPRGKRRAQTRIDYPGWDGITGSVSFVNLNGDGYTDLFLMLSGTVGDDRSRRDTVRRLVVFGGHGLDSLPTLNIGDAPRLQHAPFRAMDLTVGEEIARPARRDLSGHTSYEILPIDFANADPDTNGLPGNGLPENGMPGVHDGRPPALTSRADQRALGPARELWASPNPASDVADIRAVRLQEGIYQVEVVAANGETVLRRDAAVPASGALAGTFDISGLPVGYYTVRLARAGRAIGTYPLVVMR